MRNTSIFLILTLLFSSCDRRDRIIPIKDNKVAIQLGDSILISLWLNDQSTMLKDLIVEDLQNKHIRYDYGFDTKGLISYSKVPRLEGKYFFIDYSDGLTVSSTEMTDSIMDGLAIKYENDTVEMALQKEPVKYFSKNKTHKIYAKPSKYEVLSVTKDSLTFMISHDLNEFERVGFRPFGYSFQIWQADDMENFKAKNFVLGNNDSVQTYRANISHFDGVIIMGGRYFAESVELDDKLGVGDYLITLDTIDLAKYK